MVMKSVIVMMEVEGNREVVVEDGGYNEGVYELILA